MLDRLRLILTITILLLVFVGCQNREKIKKTSQNQYAIVGKDTITTYGYTFKDINYDSLSVRSLPSLFAVSKDGKYGYSLNRQFYIDDYTYRDALIISVIDLKTNKLIAKSLLDRIIATAVYKNIIDRSQVNFYVYNYTGFSFVIKNIFPSTNGLVINGYNGYPPGDHSFVFINNKLELEKTARVFESPESTPGYCIDYGDSAMFISMMSKDGWYYFKNTLQHQLLFKKRDTINTFVNYMTYDNNLGAYLDFASSSNTYKNINFLYPWGVGPLAGIVNNNFIFFYLDSESNLRILVYNFIAKKAYLFRSKSFQKLIEKRNIDAYVNLSFSVLGVSDKYIYIKCINTEEQSDLYLFNNDVSHLLDSNTVFAIPNILKNVNN